MTAHALDHHSASDCPNCGAAVSGNFCQQCGQEAVLHPPSIHEFMHEFVGHYVALEGKLWKTLRLLILKPGELTVEYMAGRRVRYIQPLRVYLTFSLVFFALVKFMGEEHHIGNVTLNSVPLVQVDSKDIKPKSGAAPQPPAQATSVAKAGPAAPGAADAADAAGTKPMPARPSKATGVDQDDEPGLADQIAADLEEAGVQQGQGHAGGAQQGHVGFGHFIGQLVERAAHGDTAKLKATFFGYTPYAVFALMPLFALYLKVLYLGSGRRYGEHLLFALHTNAFAFLMLATLLLIPQTAKTLGAVLFFWLMFYLPFAMRRVYGSGRLTTFLRWIVLMLLHLISVSVAVSLVLYLALTH